MLARIFVIFLLSATGAYAQALNSGSNGFDGALTLTAPGEVIFDPVAMGIDLDRDNVLHFTTITIGPGVIVKMPFNALQGLPVIWLATGAVVIDGTIDLNGENGADATAALLVRAALPGPGGYPGGVGQGGVGFFGTDLRGGLGPGGGTPGFGTNAAHAVSVPGATAYGNVALIPLRGGSGGAGGGGGGCPTAGGGGGAAGGALRIFSSISIQLSGGITADGGRGGSAPIGACQPFLVGGGGSGGSIHLIAPTISGSGTLSTKGGQRGDLAASFASQGRVRLEAVVNQFAGTIDSFVTSGTPYNVPLPAAFPSVRVTSIAGISVSPSPTGDATILDATISAAGAVTVAIEARNIPLGTVLQVRVMSEAVPDFVVSSTPLAGTLQLSTATASVTFPPGFSRGFVRATWTPPPQ